MNDYSELIQEFCDEAFSASYHYAAESPDYAAARPHEKRFQEIYDNANAVLKRELEAVYAAGGYLVRLKRSA